MPPAPAHHYLETYRDADLENLSRDFAIPEIHRNGLGPFLEDIAAIWRWKSSGELSVKAPATVTAEIRGIAKKAGSLKKALEDLSDPACTALNVALEGAIEREFFTGTGSSETKLGLINPLGDDAAYPDLDEITQLIAALEHISSNVPHASASWKGPRKSAALSLWIGNVATFWMETLGREFTRDVTDTGEPISEAARFCVAAFASLSPETPSQTVLNAMKAYIAAANK